MNLHGEISETVSVNILTIGHLFDPYITSLQFAFIPFLSFNQLTYSHNFKVSGLDIGIGQCQFEFLIRM
jgi:hypothetical protein